MGDKAHWFKGANRTWLLAIILSGTVLIWLEQPVFLKHPHAELFLREVAFALLISSIFGLTLEQLQRKEFIRLVTGERETLKRDVFLYAYGNALPEAIREEIHKSVLNSFFYREDVAIDWEFSDENPNNMIMVKKTYAYTVVNNSDQDRTWPFAFTSIAADDPQPGTKPNFVMLRLRKRSSGETTEHFPSTLKMQIVPGQPHLRKCTIDVAISARERIDVYFEMTQERRPWGEDNFSCNDVVVGQTRVRLRFPLKANFQATVSCKHKQLSAAPDDAAPGLFSFETREGVFPYQGFVISWSKGGWKKPKTTGGI